MQITKRKIFIGIAALILLIIGLGVILVYPMINNIGTLSGQMEDQLLLLKKNNLKEQNLKTFKEKQSEIELQLENMEGSIISSDDNLEYILLLEKIAKNTDVKQSINISKVVEEKESVKSDNENKDPLEDLPHMTVDIQLEGKYKNILTYLLYLESLKIYSDIFSLDIKLKSLEKLSSIDQRSIEKAEVGEEDVVKADFKARVFTND